MLVVGWFSPRRHHSTRRTPALPTTVSASRPRRVVPAIGCHRRRPGVDLRRRALQGLDERAGSEPTDRGHDPDGHRPGYWLVAGDGGIFSFGDRALLRVDRQHCLESNRFVGMAATATGKGYWLVAGRRGHLQLRRRALLRLHGRAPPQPTRRGDGGVPHEQGVLARRRPRLGAIFQLRRLALLRVHGRPAAPATGDRDVDRSGRQGLPHDREGRWCLQLRRTVLRTRGRRCTGPSHRQRRRATATGSCTRTARSRRSEARRFSLRPTRRWPASPSIRWPS